MERFPAEARLKKRSDFLKVQNSGTKLKSKHFILAALTGEGQTRLGITVTTKVDKRANRRNLLKRRIRELYRKELASLNKLFPGYSGVVIALQGSTSLPFPEVASELCFLIRKAKKVVGAQ